MNCVSRYGCLSWFQVDVGDTFIFENFGFDADLAGRRKISAKLAVDDVENGGGLLRQRRIDRADARRLIRNRVETVTQQAQSAGDVDSAALQEGQRLPRGGIAADEKGRDAAAGDFTAIAFEISPRLDAGIDPLPDFRIEKADLAAERGGAEPQRLGHGGKRVAAAFAQQDADPAMPLAVEIVGGGHAGLHQVPSDALEVEYRQRRTAEHDRTHRAGQNLKLFGREAVEPDRIENHRIRFEIRKLPVDVRIDRIADHLAAVAARKRSPVIPRSIASIECEGQSGRR